MLRLRSYCHATESSGIPCKVSALARLLCGATSRIGAMPADLLMGLLTAVRWMGVGVLALTPTLGWVLRYNAVVHSLTHPHLQIHHVLIADQLKPAQATPRMLEQRLT